MNRYLCLCVAAGTPSLGCSSDPPRILHTGTSEPAATDVSSPLEANGPVTWTNRHGVSVVDGDLVKTARRSWTNGGAISEELIGAGEGYVEWVATETVMSRAVGLSNTDPDRHYKSIGFGITMGRNSTLYVWESGTRVASTRGIYHPGDIFRIAIRDDRMNYYHNGGWFYRSTRNINYPLFVDTAMYETGSTIEGVTLFDEIVETGMWTNVVGADVIDDDGLRKTSPAGWSNSGAVSSITIASGDAHVSFVASETNTERMLGFGHEDVGQSYEDLDYAIWLRADGQFGVYEAGTEMGVYGSYAEGDAFSILISPTAVRYVHNGLDFYDHDTSPAYPLMVDTSLNTPGATLTDVSVGTGICGNGTIDAGEDCDGSACCRDSCRVETPGVVCRSATGLCDLEEVCDGISSSCPEDDILDNGTLCRVASGDCDVDDFCDGSSKSCVDTLEAGSTICRQQVGECDVADTCTGASPLCPDEVADGGTVCNPARSECDRVEHCDGLTKVCPPDEVAGAGDPCGDGVCDACDAGGLCLSGGSSCFERRFYFTDHQGSTVSITDEGGAILCRSDYFPYGAEYATGDSCGKLKYNARYQDEETGLYYYGARYYDPYLGRFVSPDPHRGKPEELQSHNRYAYVMNNPYTYVDPSGNQAKEVNRWYPFIPLHRVIDGWVQKLEAIGFDGQGSQGNSAQIAASGKYGFKATKLGIKATHAVEEFEHAISAMDDAAMHGKLAKVLASNKGIIGVDAALFAIDPSVENGVFITADAAAIGASKIAPRMAPGPLQRMFAGAPKVAAWGTLIYFAISLQVYVGMEQLREAERQGPHLRAHTAGRECDRGDSCPVKERAKRIRDGGPFRGIK